MRREGLVLLTLALFLGVSRDADAQSYLMNHIGDLSGDPQALEFVPNGGTWFGSFYTLDSSFFGSTMLSSPGGSSNITSRASLASNPSTCVASLHLRLKASTGNVSVPE